MDHSSIINESLSLAQELQKKMSSTLSKKQERFFDKMSKLLNNPKNKVMLVELLDRCFRTKDNYAVYELISFTFEKYGIANFFNPFEKILIQAFLGFGKSFPKLSVPLFVSKLKSRNKNLILNNDEIKLRAHIKIREEQKINLNFNLIGEEVLGNLESEFRMQKYIEALDSDYINYISIKITTIFSQINPLAFEYSKEEIIKRLDILYEKVQQKQKQGIYKFVNLDMEEFKDLELTIESFMESLAKFDIKAGIVLQAYVPDSYNYLKELVEFSKKRVLDGKPAIKIRLVKGANMQSEEVIGGIKGWPCPTFSKKVDTDSNYNKMLQYVLSEDNFKYVEIGIASHNIFQIAYAMTLIKHHNAENFTFEMLEGMNLSASLEVSKYHKTILYAPICDDSHFNNAIAYLVRRLDENTHDDNFMRYAFSLKINSPEWQKQEKIFLDSFDNMENIQTTSFRIQNRNQKADRSYCEIDFSNEPDTDFILKHNRSWALDSKNKFLNADHFEVFPIIGDMHITNLNPKNIQAHFKIDSESERIYKKIGTLYNADEGTIKKAISFAKEKPAYLSFDEIHSILLNVAHEFSDRRGDFLGICALEVGKTFIESDAEVSEAIDFLRFYPHSMKKLLREQKDCIFTPKGIGVAITPWNFPVGISVGSIASGLATGNKIIYKPSSLSTITAKMICECFYAAGLPKDYLIFLPASGNDINEFLLPHVDFVILTGGENTAMEIRKRNPTLLLSAETGGKNATIVSKMSDREQAVKNIIHSAFSNSGQKCSATSLLILEKEVYEDENFKKMLVDATSSLNVGDPFNFKNKLGYLSSSLDSKVKDGLVLLDNETWALEPKFKEELEENNYFMSPGIKYGVDEGSYSHTTEFFVPLLSVLKAENLEHAIYIANSTPYGLTSALESLDEREIEYYTKNIQAGNIYVNKPSTGAIVLRQPFGGIKSSSIGYGRKVGSYNYVTQFLNIANNNFHKKDNVSIIANRIQYFIENKLQDIKFKDELVSVINIINNYQSYNSEIFTKKRDYVNIKGEDNIFYYVPVKNIIYRVSSEDSLSDIFCIMSISNIIGSELTFSVSGVGVGEVFGFVLENLKNLGFYNIKLEHENCADFIQNCLNYEVIRYLKKPDLNDEIYRGIAQLGKIITNHKPFKNGYIELLFYHTERTLSNSYHRYGNLGSRILI